MVNLTGPEALANAAELRSKGCKICSHGESVFSDDSAYTCKIGKVFFYRNYYENCGFILREENGEA